MRVYHTTISTYKKETDATCASQKNNIRILSIYSSLTSTFNLLALPIFNTNSPFTNCDMKDSKIMFIGKPSFLQYALKSSSVSCLIVVLSIALLPWVTFVFIRDIHDSPFRYDVQIHCIMFARRLEYIPSIVTVVYCLDRSWFLGIRHTFCNIWSSRYFLANLSRSWHRDRSSCHRNSSTSSSCRTWWILSFCNMGSGSLHFATWSAACFLRQHHTAYKRASRNIHQRQHGILLLLETSPAYVPPSGSLSSTVMMK